MNGVRSSQNIFIMLFSSQEARRLNSDEVLVPPRQAPLCDGMHERRGIMQNKSAFRGYASKIGGGIARGAITATLVATLVPAAALAAPAATASASTGSYDITKIADGTYTGTAEVVPVEEDSFTQYTLTAEVTVANHEITNVAVSGGGSENATYLGWAANGRTRQGTTHAGVVDQIKAASSTTSIDTVSGATCSSTAIKEAVDDALAKAPEVEPEPATDELAVGSYALVNIPYAQFYASETGSNTTSVDVLTSATKNKTTAAALAGSTYHTEDGSEITGVTYAVKVGDEAAAKALAAGTKVDTADALASAGSYSYVALTEEPSSYKTVTADASGNLTFSAVSDKATVIDGTSGKLSTNTTWGNYELDFGSDVYNAVHTDGAVIAGAVINTSDGSGYGLRPLANIWNASRGSVLEFAWSPLRDEVHEVQTNGAYYASLMGKTITSITVYTDKGTYEINTGNVYVPYQAADQTLEAEDTKLADEGTTTVKVNASLSKFTNPTYTLDGNAIELSADGTITVPEGTLPGTHTLVAKDSAAQNYYADVSTSFVLSTDKAVATYDATGTKLVPAEGATEADFKNYVANISSVTVNGASYATGRRGVTVINSDGSIDINATSGRGNDVKNVFDVAATKGTYEVSVASTGYSTPLSFTVNERVFPDVDYTLWFGSGVRFCNARGIITGYDNGSYGVGDPLTRGQFATILWRIAEPEAAASYDKATAVGDTTVSGIQDHMYYTAAANWAVENGVITGYERADGSYDFAPQDPVTPEQVATILARYTDATASADDLAALADFTDGSSVDAWAREGVAWAKASGLITGYDNTDGSHTLKPQENIARERAATIIMRAYENDIL